MAGRSIATQGTSCPSLSLVCRQVLLLHLHLLLLHLHRRILWLPRNMQQHQEVKVRVKKYRGNLSHGSADTENPNKNDNDEELQSDLLQDVPDWLQEFKGNLVDEKCSRTPRVLLMNCLQSREQKWYRASTVFTLTSCDVCLRTKITRASCRGCAGTFVPRAENFGDLTTADHKSSQWRMWISKQSSIRCCGARLGNTVVTIRPR